MFKRRQQPDHVEVLARTAELELSLGVGSWQDTIAQMNELISQLDAKRKEHRSAEDALIDQLRRHVSHLESVLHRREDEYDQLQERFCALQESDQRL
jgi:predicted nuclease with TOPRIM domain